MDEVGVLESLAFVKPGHGDVEDCNKRVIDRSHVINRRLIVTATLLYAWRPNVIRTIVRGILVSRPRNGEGGRVGFLWQALHGLALGHVYKNQSGVIFHALFNEAAGTVALFASLSSARPWSVEIHAPYSLRANPGLLAFKLARADLVIAISQYIANAVTQIVEPRSMKIIHCGIDLGSFPFSPKTQAETSPITVVSVGSLIPKKGHDTLIGASAALAMTHEHHTLIVGGGAGHAVLHSLIDDTHAPVTLTGQISPDEAQRMVRDADVFVLACRVTPDGDEDGIPVAIMEAMALGVPVVSTTVAGIPELLENGSTGLMCPPNDEIALASCIRELLSNSQRRRTLVHAARTKVERDFSNQHETEKLIELLRAVPSVN